VKGLDSIVALGVIIPDIHFSTLHFADQLNLFSKHGVAVKVTEFAGSTTGELAKMLKDKKVDIGNRLDRRPHLLYRKRGRRQDHRHLALLVLEVAADYAKHPARALAHVEVAEYFALELQMAAVENDIADNLSKQESVLEDCD
jgi:hypothetical protein